MRIIFVSVMIGLLLFATLLVLYRWLPRTKVHWRAAAWGGLIGSIGISIVTTGRTGFLERGLANYNLVYGSLGAIVALLFSILLPVIYAQCENLDIPAP